MKRYRTRSNPDGTRPLECFPGGALDERTKNRCSAQKESRRPDRSGHSILTLALEVFIVTSLIWIGFIGCHSLFIPDQGGNSDELHAEVQQIMRTAMTSDGKTLWCQLGMWELIAVDLETNQVQPVYRRRNDAIGNWGISFDGRTVLYSNQDNEVEIIRDGATLISEQVPECQRLLTDLAANGQSGIRVANGTLARYWKFSEDDPLVVDFTLEIPAGKLALDPRGQVLAVSTLTNGIALYDVMNGVRIHSFRDDSRHVKSLLFSDDGGLLAVVQDRNVIVYDAPSGEKLWLTKMSEGVPFISLAFTRESGWLAATSPAAGIQIFDAREGTPLHRLPVEAEFPRIAFARSSDVIYSTSGNGTLRTWSISESREMSRVDLIQRLNEGRKSKR